MARARGNLQIVDRQYKAPSITEAAETAPGVDPVLFSEYAVHAVAKCLTLPGRLLYNFDCRQISGSESGMYEFEITNQGRDDFPYRSLWVRFLLHDGQDLLLTEVRLNRRPGYVTPYFDPQGDRLPVGETFSLVEVYKGDGLVVSTMTDAQPYSEVSAKMQDASASNQIYTEHLESGAPHMYAADMPAAVESAVHYWEAIGLNEACNALSYIMQFEDCCAYEQYVDPES